MLAAAKQVCLPDETSTDLRTRDPPLSGDLVEKLWLEVSGHIMAELCS